MQAQGFVPYPRFGQARKETVVVRMRSMASATCALLALATPGLGPGSDSISLRDGALPVRVAAATTHRSFVTAEAGTWAATASMSTARYSLTATRLGNGR